MMVDVDPDAAALEYLQGEYGEWYWIVRTPSMWIATARMDDGTEPTIIRESAHELAVAMERPEPCVGKWDPL